MTPRWHQIVHWLQLSRLELVASAVSNTWLVILLARTIEPGGSPNPVLDLLPLWVCLMLGAAMAIGLSVFGIGMNDLLDVRRDRTFSPNRPLPAGRIAVPAAAITAVACLLAALGAAIVFGQETTLLFLVTAVAILFYNISFRFLPAVGLVSLGLMRGANMIMPAPTLGFTWPVVLMISHVMACAAIAHAIEGKRPRLGASELAQLVAGWAFWTLLLVAWMDFRGMLYSPDRPGQWTAPLLAVGGFIVVAWWTLRHRVSDLRQRRTTADDFSRLAALWIILFDAAWLYGAGLPRHAAVFVMLFLFSLGASRLVRHLSQLATTPSPTYRIDPQP